MKNAYFRFVKTFEIIILEVVINPNPLEEGTMKHTFYDVKAKKKVEAEVINKVTYGKKGNERYAFKAKTADGRNLTAFVSKDVWDRA